MSISFVYLNWIDTTRSPRAGEQNGRGMSWDNYICRLNVLFILEIEYHFVTRPDMEKMIANGEFLETTEFSSNLYGTRLENIEIWYFKSSLFWFSKKAVEDVAQTGRICLLDVDKQGVKNIRSTDLNPIFIYISPPSYEILEKRLRGRQTDTEAAIEKRLNEAKESMEFSKEPGMYDHVILNDKLEEAYQQLREILRKVNDFLFNVFFISPFRISSLF